MSSLTMKRVGIAAAMVALLGSAACSSDSILAPIPSEPAMPGAPATEIIGMYRVDVDVTAGTITTTPIDNNASSNGTMGGANLQIYGTREQAAFRFAFRSPPTVDAQGRWNLPLQLKVENLMSFAVGTSQSGNPAAARDTLGEFVFLTTLPVATSGCAANTPGCMMTVVDQQGQASFTTLAPQPYWYFNDILQATDGIANSGPDLSRSQNVTFLADTAIKRYSFGIAVSAAWQPPNETRWKVDYRPDSLPTNGTEPFWKLLAAGSADASITTANCPIAASSCLTLSANGTTSGPTYMYYRADSLGATQDAYVSFSYNAVYTTGRKFQVGEVGMADDAKLIMLAIGRKTTSFVDAAGNAVGPVISNSQFTSNDQLRIAKNGNTSVALFIGLSTTPAITLAYNQLPASPYAGASASQVKPSFMFGVDSLDGNSFTASWSNVTYEIGVAQP